MDNSIQNKFIMNILNVNDKDIETLECVDDKDGNLVVYVTLNRKDKDVCPVCGKPGEKLVGDITYIYTAKQGWTYLAIVMDLFDHKVIGYSYGLNMSDDLSVNALNKALANRPISKDCIFHSDRGVQYTSKRYETFLIENGIQHSYSKKGYPYDNAAMESFNATLKKEEVNHKKYADYNEARLSIFEFIESWYNLKRIHSSIGYLTPEQKYQEYLANQIVS